MGSQQHHSVSTDQSARSSHLRSGAPRPLLPRSVEARLGTRHHEILEHLEALILSRGFAPLTIADLAASSGCSRRTLYEIASSKDQLVLVVVDRFLHKKGRAALDAIDPTTSYDTQIRGYLAGGVTFAWESRLADDLADDAPARRLVDHHYRFVMTVVERLVSLGVAAGEFRPVNPAIVAATITGATLYIDEPDMADRLGLTASDTLEQILDLVLPSLTAHQQPTSPPLRPTTGTSMTSDNPTATPTPSPTAPPTASSVLADLLAEQAALDAVVTDLDPEQWSLATPSDRWDVADQVGHLTHFDETASWAIVDESRFKESMSELMGALAPGATPDQMDDLTLGRFRSMKPAELMETWRANRQLLADAAGTLDDDTRVIWYGPSMGAKSFLTARLMECWAHGQHICDAVGAERDATDRLQHIAQLGFITRKWTYINRGLDAPSTPVRVTLDAPSGATWSFGPDDASETVIGSAEDFCLVVTQCRNVTSTDLVVTGDSAIEWMSMAQAFAGGATDSPSPT